MRSKPFAETVSSARTAGSRRRQARAITAAETLEKRQLFALTLVADLFPGPGGADVSWLTAFDDALLFSANDDLYRTNGTTNGTVKLAPTGNGLTGPKEPSSLTVAPHHVYFFGRAGVVNGEAWETDGTAVGTRPLRNDPLTFGPSSPTGLTVIGDTLFFEAENQLWKSTSAGGTELVEDVSPTAMRVVDDVLFFLVDAPGNNSSIWRSTAPYTASTTALVANVPEASRLTSFRGDFYFTAFGSHLFRNELWRSDGTLNGTSILTETDPSVGSGVEYLTVVGDTLYFTAYDSTHGEELWKTDGSPAGTTLVRDINPGNPFDEPGPIALTKIGGALYFLADDGTHGREVWRTDGTEDGTVRLTDLPFAPASSLTAAGDAVYFVADDGIHGRELYRLDGSNAGATLVADLNPGVDGSDPSWLTDLNGTLFFAATDGASGNELWALDVPTGGTDGGTDTTPPLVTLPSTQATPSGAGWQELAITITDDAGVDEDSLGSDDLVVTAPNGDVLESVWLDTGVGSTPTAVVSVYRLYGAFTPETSGAYTVAVRTGEIKDTSGNAAPAGVVGTVNFNFGTPPTPTPTPTEPAGLLSGAIAGTIPTSVIAGGRVKAKPVVAVRSATSAPFAGVASVALYLSADDIYDTADVPVGPAVTKSLRLKPDASKPVKIALPSFPTVTDGVYRLLAKVTDPAGGSTVTAFATPITIRAPFVDLAASLAVPLVVRDGKTSIAVSLQNLGNVDAIGSAVIALRADGAVTDQPLATLTKPVRIKAGRPMVVKLKFALPAGLAPGTYTALGIVTATGFIDSSPGNDTFVAGVFTA